MSFKEYLLENVQSETLLKNLEAMLKFHDWYFEYADDRRSWAAGNDSLRQIQNTIKQLRDANLLEPVKELWKKYAPEEFKFPE